MSFTVRKFSRKIPWGQKALTGCVTGLDQRQNSVMCRTVQQGCRELGGGGGSRDLSAADRFRRRGGKGVCVCVCVAGVSSCTRREIGPNDFFHVEVSSSNIESVEFSRKRCGLEPQPKPKPKNSIYTMNPRTPLECWTVFPHVYFQPLSHESVATEKVKVCPP